MNGTTVEQNDSLYEIYYENDGHDGVANSSNIDLTANNLNYSLDEPNDVDVDGGMAFGTLIIRELQKMTPEAKREFKRNVTQMLFC